MGHPNGQTSLSPSHNMANMYKKTTFGNGCEYQVSRLVVQTKPNRYKVGISDIQSHLNFYQLLSN